MNDINICPACGSVKQDSSGSCDCKHQKRLMSLFTKANIPYEYWFLDLSDFKGSETHKKEIQEYCSHLEQYLKNSIGVFLYGSNGTGKTLLAVSILKAALRKKMSGFFSSYSSVVAMFTSTWSSEAAKAGFEKNIEHSDFLIIDDLGKEYSTKNNLAESILDRVIRYRKGPTIITSNKNAEELRTLYGGTWGESLCSLVYGKTIQVRVTGRDFRKDISSELKELGKSSVYKPLK